MSGVYVHIPFCQKKCRYCDFISFDDCTKEIQKKYVECLLEEIKHTNFAKKIDTIYLGGGTPSILEAQEIQRILQAIWEQFDVAKKAEITIEINPGTVDLEKLEAYQKSGINRLSIGLQATQNHLLEMLGRIHYYEEFEKAYREARQVGFANMNVDLMLGLPKQRLEDLEESLQKVIALNPEHISIYSLILEEGTPLEKSILAGTLKMPSEDLERKMYGRTKKILEQNGYVHYEISNFAKNGFASKHNLACWEQEEYIGFGVGAHSYVDRKRFSNTENLAEYRKNIECSEFDKNRILQEEQNFEAQAKEYMMLGFRKLEGISISKFEQKFHVHPLFYFRFEISKLEKEGLIEVDLDKICLTKKGLNFANLVFEEFV